MTNFVLTELHFLNIIDLDIGLCVCSIIKPRHTGQIPTRSLLSSLKRGSRANWEIDRYGRNAVEEW